MKESQNSTLVQLLKWAAFLIIIMTILCKGTIYAQQWSGDNSGVKQIYRLGRVGIGYPATPVPNLTDTLSINGSLRITDNQKVYLGNSYIQIGTGTKSLTFYGDISTPNNIGLTLFSNGHIGIGNLTQDNGYELSVCGKIRAKGLQIMLTNWSDFVFEKDYQLMPLNELDSYIKENKHLPGIQTEKEVKEGGVDIGEFQGKLLQKIEELTLYLIEENKKLEEQSAILQKLEDNSEK